MDELNIAKTRDYSISDAAGLLGISRRTLLRYTQAGLVRCRVSRANGRKRYSGAELILLYSKI